MKKKLFLTGTSGCGKAQLLQELLGESAAYAGGLLTKPVLREDGSLLGHELLPAAALNDRSSYQGLKYIDYSSGRATKDNEIIRNQGSRFLQEAAYYSFAVLDEIGGIEMLIPQFRAALSDLLNSEQPVIGCLKSKQETEAMKKSFRLGIRFNMLIENLHSVLAADSDTVVLEVKGPDDPVARRIIKAWIDEYAHF